MRSLVPVVLAPLLCLALAGCSEEPEATPVKESPQLTRDAFVDRANGLCRRAQERIDDVARRAEGRGRQERVEAALRATLPIQRKLTTDLRGLVGPPRLERQVDPILDEVERLTDYIAEDPARYDELLFSEVDKGFIRLGITVCGE